MMSGMAEVIARGNAVCIAVLVMWLLLVAQGCGGGQGNTTTPMVDHGAQVASPPPQTSAVAVPRLDIDLAKPKSLARKEELIQELFSWPVYVPGVEVTGRFKFRACDNLLFVFYPSHLDLATVIERRRALAEHPAETILNADGYEVEAGTIDAQVIDAAYALADPSQTPQLGLEEQYHQSYFAVSRFLAAEYGMELRDEIHYGPMNRATFEAPEGTDMTALALAIQRENNDIVDGVEPQLAILPADYELRDWDPQLDPSDMGTDINVETNGPDYWNTGQLECFNLFQVNAHPLHGGYYDHGGPSASEGLGTNASAWVIDTGCIADHDDMPYGENCPPGVTPALVAIDNWDGGGSNELYQKYEPKFHGTLVTGIIAAKGRNQLGMAGMIPHGQTYPVTSQGSIVGLYSCLPRVIAWKNEHGGPAVANFSFCVSGTSDQEYWKQVLQLIHSNPDFIVVTSAGNDGECTTDSVGGDGEGKIVYVDGAMPAALAVMDAQVITVGGVKPNETKWGDSNWPRDYRPAGGLAPSVAASSYHALTTNHLGYYSESGGTSVAAPAVAGAVGLLQAYAPELTGPEVRQHVEDCARSHVWGGEDPLPLWPDDVQVPILDVGQMLTWIAIDGLADNQNLEHGTRIKTLYNIAGGLVGDDQRPVAAEFFIKERDGSALSIGTDDDPSLPVPPQGEDYGYSVVFDLGLVSEGNSFLSELVVTLTVGGAGEPRDPFTTHPIPIWIQKEPWDINVLEGRSFCAPLPGDLAVGVDHNGRIIAGWRDQSAGELKLAAEIDPGMLAFTVNMVESDVYTPVPFSDLSIGNLEGVRGLYYQRHINAPPPGDGRMGFAWFDGGSVIPVPDPNGQPYMQGYGAASLRGGEQPAEPEVLCNTATGEYQLATRGVPDWSTQSLGGGPAGCLVPGGKFYTRNGEHRRGAFEAGATSLGDLGVFYGIIDAAGGLINYTRLPLLDNTVYQQWRGTALIPRLNPEVPASKIDDEFAAVVIVRGANYYYYPPTYAAVYAGIAVPEDSPLDDFELSVIEECEDNGYDLPYNHGWAGSALYIPERDQVVVAYLSGVNHDGDTLNLKVAYLLEGGGWAIEVVDIDANYDSVAIGSVGGRVMVLYVQHYDVPFYNNVMLALEPYSTP